MIRSTDKVMIFGRSGCGKSYLGRRIQNIFPRRIIFDTLDEYSSEDGEIISDFNYFCERIVFLKQNNIREFTLIYQFNPESQNSKSEFDQMLRILYFFGDCLIVIEEIQDYAPIHSLPHWLRQALLKGRHKGLALIFTSQRPGEVHKTVVSQSSHIFCGTIVDGNDLRYLTPIFREKTNELTVLPDREFLYFGRDGVKKVENNI